MKRYLMVIFTLILAVSCRNMRSETIETYGGEVLSFCIAQAEELARKSLSEEVDQAYVYMHAKGSWVYFTRGAVGTFGERSLNYRVLLSCAVLNGPPMKVVFLGEPLKSPVIKGFGRTYFDSPEGSTEILFKRENGKFEFCCSQPFDEKNIDRHNPDYPWETGMVE